MPASTSHAARGRIGGLESWAKTVDRSARTAPGRTAARERLDARLRAEHGIDAGAPDADRRLAAARRAHFARLALKSAKARSGGAA